MGRNNVVFLEVIEWFDESGKELVHRIPETGSGEIKWGAQMTVRESQAAVFFYNGKAYDAFGPGRHTLKTANIPLLTKILSLPWGMTSPLRAKVYFTNMKVFPTSHGAPATRSPSGTRSWASSACGRSASTISGSSSRSFSSTASSERRGSIRRGPSLNT
jgi:hypothetical protein